VTPAGGGFQTTRWSIVNAAGHPSNPQAAKALAELCQIYWPPLYGFLRGRGLDREAAQDLTQGFFARLLERHDVRAADQSRGRFRAFLLTALKRYAINEHERASSMRRGGTQIPLSLDFDQAERSFAVDQRNDDTPERVFDRKWAAITLDRALQRLRDECIQSGKGKTADALMPYLTDTGNLPAYREIAAALDLTEGAVKVAVHRLRQRFGEVLRLEIGDTVVSPADVDDEMRELIRVVST